MSKGLTTLFLYLLLSIAVSQAFAQQQDTTKVKISEELTVNDNPNLVLVPKYKNAGADFDERHLLRLEVGTSIASHTFDTPITLGLDYEKKVSDSPFSVKATITRAGVFRRYIAGNRYIRYTEDDNRITNEFGIVNAQLDLSVRYYYRLSKQMRKGKSGNNLNGFYLEASSWELVRHVDIDKYEYLSMPDGDFQLVRITEKKGVKVRPTMLAMTWGYQQRFFSRMYVDFSIGPSVSLRRNEIDRVGMLAKLKLGIALWRK
ncbi:MAG: hypothetical protein Roseis2KO_13580 [Roseivirga sp.]